MKVLAIGAHPDDIEFGCGGTLLTHRARGDEILLFVLTDGRHGGDPDVRRREQQRAAELLGAKLFWGNYTDTELHRERQLIMAIESVIRAFRPDRIFVHYLEDTHQDHRHLAEATLTAGRYVRDFFYYEGPTTLHFHPTVFVDIEAVFEQKGALLKAHASQVEKTNIRGLSILELARVTAHFRGIQAHVPYAEGFVPVRLLL